MTVVRISRVHAPVTVLGPGRRLGVWFQGCSIGCQGCTSRDTWDAQGGSVMSVDELAAHCRSKIMDLALTGITLSGGEPFEQPDALEAFLRILGPWCDERGIDRLCYSGLPMKRLKAQFASVLGLLDAIIPEPFVEHQPTEAVWRGSGNQALVLLSDLGRSRYEDLPEAHPSFQVAVDDRGAWFVGIPKRGDMERLRRLVAARGLGLGDLSWLA